MKPKWLLLVCAAAVLTPTPLLALDDLLETECHQTPTNSSADDKIPTSSSHAESPFRVDNITQEEYDSYVAMRRDTDNPNLWLRPKTCIPDLYSDGNGIFAENFLRLACSGTTLDRPEMVEVATNISRISPRRPVIIRFERVERVFSGPSPDVLKSDVIEPIRTQVIEIEIRFCRGYTDRVTGNVYELGMLPNLYRFGIFFCMGLKLQKKDFSRMPQVKMIYFELSSIEDMEPYIFTDFRHLQLLVLEARVHNGIGYMLQYSEVERIRKLHCDCKYAWFRNFLKTTPLIATKQEGEVYAVGAYKSPRIFQNAWVRHVLSVDCTRPLMNDTIYRNNGSQYSYNTQCYNLRC